VGRVKVPVFEEDFKIILLAAFVVVVDPVSEKVADKELLEELKE